MVLEKTEIVRAFMLEPGDQFIKLGKKYTVVCVTINQIIYGQYYTDNYTYINRGVFGKNSQELIALIGKKSLH